MPIVISTYRKARMNTITVDKDKLLDTLRTNRDEHRGIFEKAVEVYRQEAAKEAQHQAERLLEGRIRAIVVALPVPEDHTEDFDRAIQMLEWHNGHTVTLTEHEFQEYVQNEWGWKRSFTTNTASYVGGAR